MNLDAAHRTGFVSDLRDRRGVPEKAERVDLLVGDLLYVFIDIRDEPFEHPAHLGGALRHRLRPLRGFFVLVLERDEEVHEWRVVT